MYSLTLQRFQIMMTVLLCVVFLYYATHHLRFSNMILYFCGLIALFYGVSTLRASTLFTYFVYVGSKMTIPRAYAFITEPYMYIVMNLENFARSIDRLDQFSLGYYTFDFVTALSGIKHWISDYFMLNETPYLISGYNTYTAFWTYYRDFGILGVFIIGVGGGYGINSLYYAFRKKPGLLYLMAYCIAICLMTFSFFNSQIGFLWFVYDMAVMFFILRMIEGKNDHKVNVQML